MFIATKLFWCICCICTCSKCLYLLTDYYQTKLQSPPIFQPNDPPGWTQFFNDSWSIVDDSDHHDGRRLVWWWRDRVLSSLQRRRQISNLNDCQEAENWWKVKRHEIGMINRNLESFTNGTLILLGADDPRSIWVKKEKNEKMFWSLGSALPEQYEID